MHIKMLSSFLELSYENLINDDPDLERIEAAIQDDFTYNGTPNQSAVDC